MNIAIYTFDALLSACVRIRVIDPLLSLGDDHEVFDGWAMAQQSVPIDGVDVAIVQRGFPRASLKPFLSLLLESAVPVIYETDDLLQQVPVEQQKRHYGPETAATIEWFARQVDVVTVSTQHLADYYSGRARQVVVLPSCLNPAIWQQSLYRPAAADASPGVRLGVMGTPADKKDFATIMDLIYEALARYPQLECLFYGCLPDEFRPDERILFQAGEVTYHEHPERLAGLGIDIALTPLLPSAFNRAKSNLKFLEFGFLGIPGLYSDLEPYRGTVIHGENGMLCGSSPAAWRDALVQLIEDAELRRRMGERARDTVLRTFMLPDHVDKWRDTLVRAAESKRSRGRTAARA